MRLFTLLPEFGRGAAAVLRASFFLSRQMTRPGPSSVVAAALAAGFLGVYLSGMAAVPFHPDEASWITMSRDFEAVFLRRDPGSIAWTTGQPVTPEIEYRLLNAPLPKYLMGLSLWWHGYTSADLNRDWAWGESWEVNQQRGNVPAEGVLYASRLPGTVLSALSPVLLFSIGRATGHTWAGLIGALLLGLNPLVLLHGRRAMAEGTALFCGLAAAWIATIIVRPTRPLRPAWRGLAESVLLGVSAGLAMCSKQTGWIFVPLAIFAAYLGWKPRWRAVIPAWLSVMLGAGLTVVALNPIMYREPVQVALAMAKARGDLVRDQTVDTIGFFFPEMLTPTPLSRLRASVQEVYLRAPAVWDVPVYNAILVPQAASYFSRRINVVLHHPTLGFLFTAITALGIGVSGWRIVRNLTEPGIFGELLLWVWGAAVLGQTLAVIPFQLQRYFMPLVPLACLFIGLGITGLVELSRGRPH